MDIPKQHISNIKYLKKACDKAPIKRLTMDLVEKNYLQYLILVSQEMGFDIKKDLVVCLKNMTIEYR